MKLKQFLKPDWRKIVVFAIIFIITYILVYDCGDILSSALCEARGFPMTCWSRHTVSKMPPRMEDVISYFGLITDLIIWYLLSCLIVWIYDKFRKRK